MGGLGFGVLGALDVVSGAMLVICLELFSHTVPLRGDLRSSANKSGNRTRLPFCMWVSDNDPVRGSLLMEFRSLWAYKYKG